MAEFFIDSNIFIETIKAEGLKEAKEIWNEILRSYLKFRFFINLIVKNEVIFHLYTKRKLISFSELKNLLESFSSLELCSEVENLSLSMIEKHKLKPNDAIILSTCKYYGIPYLISLDSDFEKPCKEEGVRLISSPEELKEALS